MAAYASLKNEFTEDEKWHNLMRWLKCWFHYKRLFTNSQGLELVQVDLDLTADKNSHSVFEPAHEIMAFFVLRKLILQTRMRSRPVGLDVWFLVGPFVYFHTSCVRKANDLARLRECAGSPEPSVVAYVISTIISWAGLLCFLLQVFLSGWRNPSEIMTGCYH